jgi:prepilin-type N-terminal cleavage/methylation domain-containing protein
MTRGTRSARRAGFTLIELLTVIAILALLTALVVAGISRVKSAQQAKVTDQTLLKLQKALETQWKVTCDKCRDDRRTFEKQRPPSGDFFNVFFFCDQDIDRAEGVWMYLNLRRALPQTFAEARSNVVLVDPASGGNVVSLPPSATFRSVPASGGTATEQSAALLYLILSQGGRGSNFALDDAMQGAQTTLASVNMQAFRDSYGTEVPFVRFYESNEVNAPPFVRARPGVTNPLNDPLDPVGRIALWTPAKRNAVSAAVLQGGLLINGRNRVATVVSAGADKTFDLSGATDDSFGYRLTREGNKGD